jgi:HEAT repeat protein
VRERRARPSTRPLARHHPEALAGRIRVDLDEDFASLREAYHAQVETAILADTERRIARLDPARRPGAEQVRVLVAAGLKKFFSEHPALEDFTLRNFQAAALRGLLAHGEAGDVRFARRFLGSDDHELQEVSVALLARFGETSDQDALLEIASSAYADQAGRAAEAALAVSDDVPSTVDRLIEIGKAQLTQIAVAALAGSSMEDAVPWLMPLLDAESEAVRREAAEALAARLDTNKGRRALLGHYLSTRSYYYYNVVVALDRILWAPGWLRAATRQAG